MTEYHNFNESLAVSHAAEDLPFWEEVYRKAFPKMSAMISHRQDGFHQRQGIDRSVILSNSKQIRIDEKVRGRNKKTGRVYDDIILEFMSDEERQEAGWVCKPLLADYIAYAIAPLGKCYILPVEQLQTAWQINGGRWKEEGYADQGRRIIRAVNKCNRSGRLWTTLSVNVTVKELFREIGNCLRVTFDGFECED